MSKKVNLHHAQKLSEAQQSDLCEMILEYEANNPGSSYTRNLKIDLGDVIVTGHYSRRQFENDFTVVHCQEVDLEGQPEQTDNEPEQTDNKPEPKDKLAQAIADGVVKRNGPWYHFEGRKTNRKSTFLSWFPQFKD